VLTSFSSAASLFSAEASLRPSRPGGWHGPEWYAECTRTAYPSISPYVRCPSQPVLAPHPGNASVVNTSGWRAACWPPWRVTPPRVRPGPGVGWEGDVFRLYKIIAPSRGEVSVSSRAW